MTADLLPAQYTVIYDGGCNLCVTFVNILARVDQGRQFRYVPMQDTLRLADWSITATDCEAGMILLAEQSPQQRWQGSAAAEKIATLLPGGAALIAAYRSVPGLQSWGDRAYAQVRDHRYAWFGQYAGPLPSVNPLPSTGIAIPDPTPDCSHCQAAMDGPAAAKKSLPEP